MSVAKALAARTITFLLDGLQGPANREAREDLEQRLGQAEARRSSEVTGLGQQLAEVVAQRDEARGSLDAVRARLADHLSDGGVLVGSLPLAIDVLAQRVKDARSDYREHDVKLSYVVDQITTIVDEAFGMQPVMTPDELLSFLEAKLKERGRDLAAARARIAELEAPLPEATVEELVVVFGDAARRTWHQRDREYRGIRAVAERVRRERCLVARAVAKDVDLTIHTHKDGVDIGVARARTEADGGEFHEGELVEREVECVPAAEVRAELARMLTEVGA